MEKRTRSRLDAPALWAYAVKTVASRAYTAGEMRQKLNLRAERASDVDEVLARLKDLRYLDDRRFAESFAASRLANERLGKARVTQELRRRRVAPALAQTAANQAYKNVDEAALIDEFIRRKYRTAAREDLFHDEKDLAAAYRRLMRAGFRTGEIVRALKRFAKNPELLDSFEPPEEEAGDEQTQEGRG